MICCLLAAGGLAQWQACGRPPRLAEALCPSNWRAFGTRSRIDHNCPPICVQANRLSRPETASALSQPRGRARGVNSVWRTRTLAYITKTLRVVGPREIFAELQTPGPKLKRYPAPGRLPISHCIMNAWQTLAQCKSLLIWCASID